MKFSDIARAQLASGLLAPFLPQKKQAFRAEQDRQSRKRMCQFERRPSQDEKEKERAAALWFFSALTDQHHTAASWSEDSPKTRIADAETRRIEIRWCSPLSCPPWVGSAERLAQRRRWRKGMDLALSGIGLAILLWWRQGRDRRC